MPPKAMKGESSTFSLLTSWMQPKPNTEHSKTDDKTPTPTEVADSSQGSEKPEKDQTLSPTELVHSPDMDYYFEQNAAYENDGSDDDDAVATDEAAAMAELVQEASLADTLQCNTGVKRKREDEAGRGKDTGERKPGQETVRRTSEPPNLRTAKKSTPDLT
jgi:hypothetical protein